MHGGARLAVATVAPPMKNPPPLGWPMLVTHNSAFNQRLASLA
jgi:hypothetical protein